MCLFKNWKLGKIKVIQVFENLCWHRPQISPNNWKHAGERRMWRSRALYVQRQTRHHSESTNGCSSHRPQSVVHWDRPFVEFSMTEKCKFPICWNSSDQKTKLVLWSWSGYLLQFLVERCTITNLPRCLKLWLSIWQPCDTGLRPPFVGLGFMAKLENWKLPSWCFRGSWRPSALWLHMRSKKNNIIFVHGSLSPPLIEELSGTNVLSQAALASAFFLYALWLRGQIAILSTVWIRKIKNTGTSSSGE